MNALHRFIYAIRQTIAVGRGRPPCADSLALHAIRLDRLARAVQAEAQALKTSISGIDQFGDPAEA